MKTKPTNYELELNNVPFETVEYKNTNSLIVCVDDVREQRWQITFNGMIASKLLDKDLSYNYNDEDFNKYSYNGENSYRGFKKYILEVEDSKWINSLKKDVEHSRDIYQSLCNAKHYLVPFYDYDLEVIACRLECLKLSIKK